VKYSCSLIIKLQKKKTRKKYLPIYNYIRILLQFYGQDLEIGNSKDIIYSLQLENIDRCDTELQITINSLSLAKIIVQIIY
jgi:hypothetical protein